MINKLKQPEDTAVERHPKRVATILSKFIVLGIALFSALGPRTCGQPVSLDGIELLPQIKISGIVGTLFRIEYTHNLGLAGDWITLNNLVLPSSPYLLIDTNAAGKARRFYRVMLETKPPQLVSISPGTFTMGSPENEADRFLDEGPLTIVTIAKAFWISPYEISQAQYLAVIGVNPSVFADDLNRPVENVTWSDATYYCSKLTEQERLAGRLPSGYSYRLPTEAEWEYAARAGTSTRFSYGDDLTYTTLNDYAWNGYNSGEVPHAIGSKLPNPWGVSDMHGNVWEWCSDWYSPGYPGGTLLDPPGFLDGSERVIRGGSWKGLNRFCRSAGRSSSLPFVPRGNVGFRVVLAATGI